MEDLLKWVQAKAAECKETVDASERALIEPVAVVGIAGVPSAERIRLAKEHAISCARYWVWLTVLHEVSRRAATVGMDATRVGAYPAIIHGPDAPGGGYGVSFPDLPGCVGAGDTAPDALADACAALALHLDGMREDGTPLPAASSVYGVAPDGGIVTLVWA